MLTKQRLFRVISYLLVLLAIFYFVSQLYQHAHEIPSLDWQPLAIAIMLATVLLTACNTLTIALNWQMLLADQKVHPPFWIVWQIVAVSQIGKYLPGNIGHFAGRGILARERGITLGVTATTISIESLWAVMVGIALILLSIWLGIANLGETGKFNYLQSEILLAALLTTLFLPTVSIWLLNRLFPSLSRVLGGGSLLCAPGWKTGLFLAAIILFNLLCYGAMLKLHAITLFQNYGGGWLQFMLLFGVAWIAGYLVPGAPGGLGVREAVMLLLFAPMVGPGVAVGISISMRVANMLGDGLAFLCGMAHRKLYPPTSAIVVT